MAEAKTISGKKSRKEEDPSLVGIKIVKEYLSDPYSNIKLHDLFLDESRRVLADTEGDVSSDIQWSEEEFLKRVKNFETSIDKLLSMYITGIYWSNESSKNLWTKILKLIASPRGEQSGRKVFINLRKYPALLLLYGGGMAALASKNYSVLADVLIGTRIIDNGSVFPASLYLQQYGVMEGDVANSLRIEKREYTPLSNYLFTLLKPKFADITPLDEEYEELFNKFEYLLSIVIADNYKSINNDRHWGPMGRFAWGHNWNNGDGIAKAIDEEISNGLADLYIKYLFNGSIDKFKAAKAGIDQIAESTNWW